MPGFGSVLSDAQLWDLIDYLRARNGGLERRDGEEARPLPAPDFDVSCAGRTQSLASLRGTALAIGFGADVSVMTADGRICTTAAAEVTEAYAIATGQTEQALAGGTVIVDANGWLRDALGPGQTSEVSAALGAAAHLALAPDGEPVHHH